MAYGIYCTRPETRISQEYIECGVIYVECGVMHIRKRGVKRTEEVFEVNGERIEVVEEFKYLGCVITEQMGSKRKVEERARAGSRALSDWLRKCRDAAGKVRGNTFVRLKEMLVESVLLYGAEVWGGGSQLEPAERVQMQAARILVMRCTYVEEERGKLKELMSERVGKGSGESVAE